MREGDMIMLVRTAVASFLVFWCEGLFFGNVMAGYTANVKKQFFLDQSTPKFVLRQSGGGPANTNKELHQTVTESDRSRIFDIFNI